MTTAEDSKSALRLWHEQLETLLVATESFRERVGKTAMIAAREHVFFDTEDIESFDAADATHDSRPLALISGEEFGYQRYGQDSTIHLSAAGVMSLLLIDNPRTPSNYKASKLEFLDFAGNVIDEMAALSGTDDFLPVEAIGVTGMPQRAPYKNRASDDWWAMAATFQIGRDIGQ